jgi:pyrroloquinoline quinone (PQQ) biosynthesis protein C
MQGIPALAAVCHSTRIAHLMISKLINDLKVHRESYIDGNPIFARLAAGDITRSHYLAYLRETYHLVKHTPNYLMIAANRVAENDERLSAYFRKFCLEETGHELLCIRDIDALGENADMILSGDPNPGAWGIVTQCYFWATQGNPIALLGDAFATEELGVARGVEVARLLETNYSIPRRATNFLRVHGSEDKKHLEAAARAIEWYAEDRDHYADIDYATKMTYRYYGQLFTDVLELGDGWSK